MSRVTHQQIAEKVGVSRTVVTEALHRTPRARIHPSTRREILRVARQLGYQPRNLTTHNIGYVLPVETLRAESDISFLMHVESELRAFGYRLTLASLDVDDPRSLRDILNSKTIDGAIFMRWYGGRIRDILPDSVPFVVSSDEDGIGVDVDLVTMDTAKSLENLTQHLMNYGHQRFCLLVGAHAIGYHERLKRGVQQSLRNANLPESNLKIIELESDRITGVEANAHIEERLLNTMRTVERPTAVIATSRGQAVPALYALRTAGYKVPGDVSIVSALDSPHFKALRPVLTATTMQGTEVARRAVQRLIEKIHDTDSAPKHVLVPGQVVPRESVAMAAGG